MGKDEIFGRFLSGDVQSYGTIMPEARVSERKINGSYEPVIFSGAPLTAGCAWEGKRVLVLRK